MSQMHQPGYYNDIKIFAEGLDGVYAVRLYAPHPTLRIVVISDRDRLLPLKMMRIANQTVATFNLNPVAVIWVEQVCPSPDFPFWSDFSLITFDWQTGQASNPQRSPIDENWYLSWLLADPQPSEPRYST